MNPIFLIRCMLALALVAVVAVPAELMYSYIFQSGQESTHSVKCK